MRYAALAKINILDFWQMTPYEISIVVQAYCKNRDDDQEERLILSYLNANWQRSTKMPSLKSILNKIKPQKRAMTPEEMLAEVKAMNAQLGGEVY